MAIRKTEALVLRIRNFRETSLIIDFFTKDFGKINGLIKGIRNEPQRYGGLPLAFSKCIIVFYSKPQGELNLVTQCDAQEQFLPIRADLDKTKYASYITELLNAVTQAYDKNEKLFQLTVDSLKALSNGYQNRQIARAFEIRLLNFSGFKPRLDACVNCQKHISSEGKFSSSLGGILCLNCSNQDSQAKRVLRGTLASIDYIEKSSWKKALQLKTTSSISAELITLLNNFLRIHLDKEIKSQKFLI